MAISGSTVWEIRTTGNQANGGGFADLDPGTSVDYSQQDSAQLALTDCKHPAGSATLTSETGGFTAAMVGNVLRVVSGTNFYSDWYQITAYVSGNEITVDSSLGSSANTTGDGVVNVGGAFLLGGNLDYDWPKALVKGNTVYIQAGTYSVENTMDLATTPELTSPINFYGYKVARGDNPTGTDRPLIAMGDWYFDAGGVTNFSHLRFTGSSIYIIECAGTFFNVLATNTSSTATRIALSLNGSGSIVSCEITAPMCIGVKFNSMGNVINCYIHDCYTALEIDYAYCNVEGCVIETAQLALDMSGSWKDEIIISHNTIVGCLTGIYATTGASNKVFNNIFANNYEGVKWTNAPYMSFFDYNCWSNNLTDIVGSTATKGDNDVTADALLGSDVVTGTDGATDADGTVFTAASNPFGSVTTSDYVNIVEAGDGATLGVYNIASVDGAGQITLGRSAGASKTGIGYRIVVGTDFTLQASSPCFNAGLRLDTYTGL